MFEGSSPGSDFQNFKKPPDNPDTTDKREAPPVKKPSVLDNVRARLQRIRESWAEQARHDVETQRFPLTVLLRGQASSPESAASYFWKVPATAEQIHGILFLLNELKKGDDLATERGYTDMPKRAEAAFSLLMSVPDLAPAQMYKLLYKLEGHDWDVESVVNDGALLSSESEAEGVDDVVNTILESTTEVHDETEVHDKQGLGEAFSEDTPDQTQAIKWWVEMCWDHGYEIVWVAGHARLKVGKVLIDDKRLLKEPYSYIYEVKSQLEAEVTARTAPLATLPKG